MERENGAKRLPWLAVIHYHDRFLAWDTTNKKPLHYNRNERDFWKCLYAEMGPFSEYYARAFMNIAVEYGSSFGPSVSREEIIRGNQLGENKEELSLDQILEKFIQEGLSENLPVEFGILTYAPGVVTRAHTSYRDRKIAEAVEEYKQKMELLGFKFAV